MPLTRTNSHGTFRTLRTLSAVSALAATGMLRVTNPTNGDDSTGGPQSHYYPFVLTEPLLVRQMYVINGTSVAGNIDVGIYSEGGIRLVSAGSTAAIGTNTIQTFDLVDTTLNPGHYYMAFAKGTTGPSSQQWCVLPSAYPDNVLRCLGCRTSADFPLPATPVWVVMQRSAVPFFGVTGESVI